MLKITLIPLEKRENFLRPRQSRILMISHHNTLTTMSSNIQRIIKIAKNIYKTKIIKVNFKKGSNSYNKELYKYKLA